MATRVMAPNPAWRQVDGVCLITAPLLLSTGWALILPTIGKGPTSAWTRSHYLLIAGYAALGPATLAIRHHVDGRAVTPDTAGTTCVLVGLPTVWGQLVFDLLAARHASTQQDMHAFFGRVLAQPMLALPFYRVGPPLLFAGLFVQALSLLARSHTRRSGALLSVGIMLLLVGQLRRAYRLVLLGHLLLLGGLAPLGWTLIHNANVSICQPESFG